MLCSYLLYFYTKPRDKFAENKNNTNNKKKKKENYHHILNILFKLLHSIQWVDGLTFFFKNTCIYFSYILLPGHDGLVGVPEPRGMTGGHFRTPWNQCVLLAN